jgi:hypothetical protein
LERLDTGLIHSHASVKSRVPQPAHPEESARAACTLRSDLVSKITSARESKGGEVNRGIIGTIIGVLVIIILVIVILQLT